MGSVSMQSVSDPRSERLSAFVDGEVSDEGHSGTFLSGLDHEERTAWSDYHLIGDVLRSDDLAVSPAFSSAFMTGFAARFETEPHLLAPAAATAVHRLRALGHRVVPSLAVAAAAAMLTWIVVPHMRGAGMPGGTQIAQVASMQRVSMPVNDGDIIRDARLDGYLEAHQQFGQQPVMSDSMPLVRAAVLTTRSQ